MRIVLWPTVRLDHHREPAKIFSIVIGHTRECLGGIVDGSVPRFELAEQLNVSAADRGMLGRRAWITGQSWSATQLQAGSDKEKKGGSPRRQPSRNGYVESFNGKPREGCLSILTSSAS